MAGNSDFGFLGGIFSTKGGEVLRGIAESNGPECVLFFGMYWSFNGGGDVRWIVSKGAKGSGTPDAILLAP